MSQGLVYFTKIDTANILIVKGEWQPAKDSTFLELLRNKITKRLDTLTVDDKSKAMLKAMIIGDKSGLSNPQKEQFRICGISHLLAISGWHVGIVFLFLNILLYPIGKIKYGTIIKSGIIVLIIWMYVALIGYSPSVCRAALMFTMFQYALFSTISRNLKYNIIFGSLFLFLCYNFDYIYDLGFQLSYTAIISIQVFYSRIYNLLRKINPKRWYIIDWIFKGLTITISAQILIIPISLYYFGTYSILSIFPNLVLGLFFPLLIIVTLLFSIYPNSLLDWIIGLLTTIVNKIIIFFEHYSIYIQGYYISVYEIIIYYFLILLIILIAEKED